ncbi:TonB-dependent receptor [Bizionia argentinensis JUB59]|uniref:TonB-dependent receptor n=1 Tax=Bizionia argentinensis JUB59 TaxID=1046627 RepID=G2EEE5_9FLAO|nr:outer membrane beta-barrel family protein [Bizionia argentinensis]EGV43130.1 TonB-dependent receptor [Bizionia argentinensis JUB59]
MNIKQLYLILLFSLVFSFSSFSQDYTVSGKIVNLKQQPIAYANILVLSNQDSTAIKGTTSLDDGSFIIGNITKENYSLKISFVGFKDVFLPIQVSNSNLVLDATILKESPESLNEVSITVNKPTLKKEVDRLVFNVANTALSEGSMIDVLRSTPSVLILNNSITVRNAKPAVYINDRKIHLSDAELLQLLEGTPANAIKSIEVITNPSAKYDADSGVVLNIVMSRNLATGYNGVAFASYTQGTYARYNAGISNFYKTDKINVFASYSYNDSKIARSSDERVNYRDNVGINERWISDVDRTTRSKTHTLNTNFDYFINEESTLSFAANLLYLPEYEYITTGQTNVLDASYNRLYNFNNKNDSNDDKYNFGFDLDYDLNFDNGSNLSLNTHLTTYDYDRDQSVKSDYFDVNNTFDYSNLFNTISNQKTLISTVQADYSIPISDSSSFITGVKASFINTDSDLKQYDLNSGTAIFNNANSNAFEYKESVFAAYASYSKSWEKWDLSFGLRAEQTNTEGKSVVDNSITKQDYFDWFPTANISFQASEAISVYSNYKRSIERPDFQSLNPFKFYLSDNTLVTGNPNLQPTITDHFVLGASLNNSFYVEAYYKDMEANSMELPIQDNASNLLVYTPTNLAQTIDYGFDFVAIFDITAKWNVYAVTSFLNWSEKATINNSILKMDTWSNYSELSNSFSFLKDNSLTANFSLVYLSKYQQGFQEVDARLISDLAIKKTVFNKRGALTLSFADLFNTQHYNVKSRYLNQDNARRLNQDSRYVKLGFSYKFGNTRLTTNQRVKDLKERSRLEKKD